MKTNILKLPFGQKEFLISGSSKDFSVMLELEKSNGFYEPGVMNLLKKVVRPNHICLDLGANIGVISLALSYLAKSGKVYSFEALKQNFNYFNKNINQNNVNNIEAINHGIYSEHCRLEFQYVKEFAGGSFTSPAGIKDHRAEVDSVECLTLDDWAAKQNINRIDFVKIDVEGSEIEVLKGANRTLNRFRPELVIEFNTYCIEKFFDANPIQLYMQLSKIYPNIFWIDKGNGSLKEIHNYSSLLDIAEKHGGIADLYCSSDRGSRMPIRRTSRGESGLRLALWPESDAY